MENHYLIIAKTSNGNIEVNSSDGVFGSFVMVTPKNFADYFEGKANEWLTSELRNYEGWSPEKRKAVAEKWLAAKDLPEGRYNYYFNLDSCEDIFRKEVASLAKILEINDYKLEIK